MSSNYCIEVLNSNVKHTIEAFSEEQALYILSTKCPFSLLRIFVYEKDKQIRCSICNGYYQDAEHDVDEYFFLGTNPEIYVRIINHINDEPHHDMLCPDDSFFNFVKQNVKCTKID